MIDTPQITQSTEVLTAVIKLTVPRAEIQKVMGTRRVLLPSDSAH